MKTSIATEKFRVRPRDTVKLDDRPTKVKPFCRSNKRYHNLLEEMVEELSALQRLHYASNRYALLLNFQGMDAAGRDGAIRHVMSGVNPQGCQVFSFKQPSAEESEHDFLWRTTRRLPARTVQSLGRNVVVFEVQHNSDVMFCLYDWDHVDAKTGQARALQVDPALACIDFVDGAAVLVARVKEATRPVECEQLLHCEHLRL